MREGGIPSDLYHRLPIPAEDRTPTGMSFCNGPAEPFKGRGKKQCGSSIIKSLENFVLCIRHFDHAIGNSELLTQHMKFGGERVTGKNESPVPPFVAEGENPQN